MSDSEQFSQWCVLELMGHRRLAGLVTEQEIAGQAFLRLDIHREVEVITQYYSPSAVYCITPTTEQIARRAAALTRPQPVHQWELEEPGRDEGPFTPSAVSVRTHPDLDEAEPPW